MSFCHPVNRRTFLQGAGVAMALPLFESLPGSIAVDTKTRPPRMICIYTPNGCNIDEWVPKTTGKSYTASPILRPLAPVTDDVTVVTGLFHPGALNGTHNNQDNWLTGTSMQRGGFKSGISVDQLAAEKHGLETRFPSLELSTLGGVGQIGHMNTLAWTRAGVALPGEKDPRVVFEKLFAADPKSALDSRSREIRRNTTVVDAVLRDARDLQRTLGSADQRKLDEYLAAVQEFERRLERAERWLRIDKPKVDGGGLVAPKGKIAAKVPDGEVRNYLRLSYDLMVLALQTDSTRVITFSAGREAGGFRFAEIGIKETHHQLSHYNGDPDLLAKLAKGDEYLVEQFVYLVKRLRETTDGDAPLLDRTMVLYGSGMSMNHQKFNLPILFAGGRSLGVKHAGHLDASANGQPRKMSNGEASTYKVDEKNARLSNLLLLMAQKMGLPTEKFADSTGPISDLT